MKNVPANLVLPTDLDPNDEFRYCVNGIPLPNDVANRINAFINRRFMEDDDYDEE